MTKQETKISSLPKGFFTKIAPCRKSDSNKSRENDKSFEWSSSVLDGKSKVKIVALKK